MDKNRFPSFSNLPKTLSIFFMQQKLKAYFAVAALHVEQINNPFFIGGHVN
jgi:hypothetical protein